MEAWVKPTVQEVVDLLKGGITTYYAAFARVKERCAKAEVSVRQVFVMEQIRFYTESTHILTQAVSSEIKQKNTFLMQSEELALLTDYTDFCISESQAEHILLYLSLRDAEIASETSALLELQQAVSAAEEEVSKLKQELETLDQEIGEKTKETERAKETMEKVAAATDVMQDYIKSCEEQATTDLTEISAVEKSVDTLQKESQTLELQLQHIKKINDFLTEKCQDLTQDIAVDTSRISNC